MDLTVKSSTWCLLHHAQNAKDNYYDHYGHDEPDDTAHLIIPSEADSDHVSQPVINTRLMFRLERNSRVTGVSMSVFGSCPAIAFGDERRAALHNSGPEADGQSLVYVYARETQAEADIAKVLTLDLPLLLGGKNEVSS